MPKTCITCIACVIESMSLVKCDRVSLWWPCKHWLHFLQKNSDGLFLLVAGLTLQSEKSGSFMKETHKAILWL